MLLVLANLVVWALGVPASASAYSLPSGLVGDYATVCPARPADSTSVDPEVVELVDVEQELSDGCVRAEQQDATSQGWAEFGTIVVLTVGLVLIVLAVAVAVVILWR